LTQYCRPAGILGGLGMRRIFQSLLLTALLLALDSLPARAGLPRVWVSGHGTDSPSCGALAAPCRQIKYALDNNLVSPGGEIDILDPAGFAPFTLTQAISIINDGVGTASVQQTTAGQNAITINAPAGSNITLKGLSIDGRGAGKSGVEILSVIPRGADGGEVDIVNCLIQNFVENGVAIKPNASGSGAMPVMDIFVLNTLLLRNGVDGLLIAPLIGLVTTVKNSTFRKNVNGIEVASSTVNAITTLLDSEIDHNGLSGGSGILAAGTRSTVKLKDSTIINNSTFGGTDILNSINVFMTDHNKIEGFTNNGTLFTDGTNSVFSLTGNAPISISLK